MTTLSPTVIVLAGPNGAGKTTAAPRLLRDVLALAEFVNADTIAQGLAGFDPELAALEAGAVMFDRIRQLSALRRSFAFETTLASRSLAPWITELMQTGYTFQTRVPLAFQRRLCRAASDGSSAAGWAQRVGNNRTPTLLARFAQFFPSLPAYGDDVANVR